jgi:phosphonate transport system substrate-binding protein
MRISSPRHSLALGLSAAALVGGAAIALGATHDAAARATSAAATSCPKGGWNFAVEPYDTNANLVSAYSGLVKDISKNLACKVNFKVTSDYVSEIEAMRAKKVDFMEVGPLGYIFAKQLAHATPVAAFGYKGKPVVYYAQLYCTKGSHITSVAGLKGKSLVLSSPTSTSGYAYPIYALESHKLNPNSDVHIKYSGSHPNSLSALLAANSDSSLPQCAEVNTQEASSASNIFKPSDFVRIWRSTAIPNDPIAVRATLGAATVKRIQGAFLKLTASQLAPAEKEFGTPISKMVKATDSLYAPVYQVIKADHLKISFLNG